MAAPILRCGPRPRQCCLNHRKAGRWLGTLHRRECGRVTAWSTVTATEEVIVCAGAINSPQSLQLSASARPICCTPRAFRWCTTCPASAPTCKTDRKFARSTKCSDATTLNTLAATRWGKLRIGWEYLLHRTGPMSMAPSQLGAFTRSSPGAGAPDLAIPRAAAVAGRVRRATARLPGVHRQRLQPQPHQPRHGAHPAAPTFEDAPSHCALIT